MIFIAVDEATLRRLQWLIEEKEWEEFEREISKLHPYDLSEFVQDLKEEQRRQVLTRLPPRLVAEFLPELRDEMQAELLELLPPRAAAELILHLQPDERADVLALLSREVRQGIMKYLPAKLRREARALLRHPSDTAGGLMTTRVLALPKDITVEEAIKFIREHASEYETIYYLYVKDEKDRLVGVLSLRELVLAPGKRKLGEVMNPDVIAVPLGMDQEEVAKIVADYDLAAVPVVDSENRLVGLVTIDDVVDVIEEEIVEDMGQLAGTGVSMDRLIEAPALEVVKARLPWLLVALIGDGLVAASILKRFEETLASVVALSLFVPAIMTMGGNVGLQTSTIFIRGLATKEISDRMRYLLREIKIGVTMALLAGAGVAAFGQIIVGKPAIGMIVGIAMFCAMSLASIMGVIIPWIFEKLKIDPAIASGPFMTTTQDITGLVVYFTLASVLLQHLV
ncbi:magnesium transporter [Candidatus Pyrohabitans sp.]